MRLGDYIYVYKTHIHGIRKPAAHADCRSISLQLCTELSMHRPNVAYVANDCLADNFIDLYGNNWFIDDVPNSAWPGGPGMIHDVYISKISTQLLLLLGCYCCNFDIVVSVDWSRTTQLLFFFNAHIWLCGTDETLSFWHRQANMREHQSIGLCRSAPHRW
jgi:hypothetical protein